MKSNRLKTLFIALFFLFIPTILIAQSLTLKPAQPSHSSSNQIIKHVAYTLKYNEIYEQADWVIYLLTAEEVKGTILRSDNFRTDTKVKTGSASLTDYRGSGYDRGHLAPAGDMKWSKTAMSESFYMSNMSPQKPGFNRGIWRSLESLVRT